MNELPAPLIAEAPLAAGREDLDDGVALRVSPSPRTTTAFTRSREASSKRNSYRQ